MCYNGIMVQTKQINFLEKKRRQDNEKKIKVACLFVAVLIVVLVVLSVMELVSRKLVESTGTVYSWNLHYAMDSSNLYWNCCFQ